MVVRYNIRYPIQHPEDLLPAPGLPFSQVENSTDDTSAVDVSYLSSTPERGTREKFLTGAPGWGGWGAGGKKRMRIHATGGAYLNSRLTFIYLATFNFYGRDPADSLGPGR